MSRELDDNSNDDADLRERAEDAFALQLEMIQRHFYPITTLITASLRRVRQAHEVQELLVIVQHTEVDAVQRTARDTGASDVCKKRRTRFGVWLSQPLAVALIILAVGTLATASWQAFIHPSDDDSVVSTSFDGVYLPGGCSAVVPPLDREHERFTQPRGGGSAIEVLPSAVSVEGGRLMLRNRGYFVVDHDFQTGVEIELKWMWTQPVAEGIYCDQLAVAVRTDAEPRASWPHETATGLIVKFDPALRQVKLVRAAGEDVSALEVLAIAEEVDLEIGQWHTLIVKDTGNAIQVVVNDTAVLDVPEADQAMAHRVAIYNREPVGGSVLRHPDKVSYLDEIRIRLVQVEHR